MLVYTSFSMTLQPDILTETSDFQKDINSQAAFPQTANKPVYQCSPTDPLLFAHNIYMYIPGRFYTHKNKSSFCIISWSPTKANDSRALSARGIKPGFCKDLEA